MNIYKLKARVIAYKCDLIGAKEVDDALNEYAANFDRALELLRALADIQNGAQLIRDEKQWNEIMKNVYEFMDKHEKS